MRQQRIELLFDTDGQVVELAQAPGAHEQVLADGKHALLPALQSFAQPLGVLERDLLFGVAYPLTAECREARGLQAGDPGTERAHHLRRGQRDARAH